MPLNKICLYFAAAFFVFFIDYYLIPALFIYLFTTDSAFIFFLPIINSQCNTDWSLKKDDAQSQSDITLRHIHPEERERERERE